MKLVLCGPPRAGKSCLRYGLKAAIKEMAVAPYPYVITANPDGEGSWFHETAFDDAARAAKLRAAYKSRFTDEHATVMAVWVTNCSVPLVLIDVGGIPDDKNENICATATHAVIISGSDDRFDEWRAFCQKLGVTILAEIFSDYDGKTDRPLELDSDGVYRGSVHHLERTDSSIKDRLTVRGFAELISDHITVAPNRKPGAGGDMNTRSYNIEIVGDGMLAIGFGRPAQNDELVRDALQRLNELIESGYIAGGDTIRINGPVSIPVAMVIAHRLAHLYQAVACYDPKLSKYVVAIAHGDKYRVGDLLD